MSISAKCILGIVQDQNPITRHFSSCQNDSGFVSYDIYLSFFHKFNIKYQFCVAKVMDTKDPLSMYFDEDGSFHYEQ